MEKKRKLKRPAITTRLKVARKGIGIAGKSLKNAGKKRIARAVMSSWQKGGCAHQANKSFIYLEDEGGQRKRIGDKGIALHGELKLAVSNCSWGRGRNQVGRKEAPGVPLPGQTRSPGKKDEKKRRNTPNLCNL